MKKVKMLNDDKYAKNGFFVIECKKGDICEVPEHIAVAFSERKTAKIITVKEVMENTAMDLSDLNHKELLEKAEQRGFKSDKRPTKPDLIEFLEK